MDAYEKVLVAITLFAGIVIVGYFVLAISKDLRTPITYRTLTAEGKLGEGFVLT